MAQQIKISDPRVYNSSRTDQHSQKQTREKVLQQLRYNELDAEYIRQKRRLARMMSRLKRGFTNS